jgi:hypothetical protein
MKQTAAHYRIGYLTANQVESYHKVFVIHNNLRGDRMGNNSSPEFNSAFSFKAFINP